MIYRWREVSISEFSKPFELLEEAVFKDHGFVKVSVFMERSRSACFDCKSSPRESDSWGVFLWSWGKIVSDWKDCLLGSKLETLSVSDKNFWSSLSSLLSFTFCNCLNLSCKRAMEELTMVGSPFCLPIEEELFGVGNIWWVWAIFGFWSAKK